MREQYIVGVDCSTTAAKAIVWDKDGAIVATGRQAMELLSPKPGWAEQRAEGWWNATAEAIRKATRQIDTQKISAIGITHQRESFVPVSEKLTVLRNAILWLDSRASSQVEKLKQTAGRKIQTITGVFPNMSASNAKIMWLRENEPAILEKAYKILDVYSYLAWKLTGQLVAAWPSASPMGLMDISELCWSEEVMALIGVRKEQFCELVPPGEIVGTLTREAALSLGLPEGTPVTAGGGDGQCAALGAGVIEEGSVSLNLGTAVVSEFYSSKYVIGESFRTLCGCVPRSYLAESVILGGTHTINWFIKEFGRKESELGKMNNISAEEVLEKMAAEIEPGKPRLLMYPFLKATMAPYWDPFARGIVIGWSTDTGKAHFYRAILEGIAFEQRFLYESMESSLNKKIEKIILFGGGAKSPLWRQIIADITGIPVVIPGTFEASCLGAAMLAAYAIGMYDSVQNASRKMSRMKKSYYPDEKNKGFYTRIYEKVYRPLFPRIQKLVDEFTRITY